MPQGKGAVIKAKKPAAPAAAPPAKTAKKASNNKFAGKPKKAAPQVIPKNSAKSIGHNQATYEEGEEDTDLSGDDEEYDSDLVSEDEDDESYEENELDEFADGEEGEEGEEDIEFSDEEFDEEDDFSDDEDDDGDFEAKAAKFKKKMKEEALQAMHEQATERGNAARSTLLDDAEREARGEGAEADHATGVLDNIGLLQQSASAEELRDRIKETVRVLSRFKDEREEGRGRDEYMALFKNDLIELYEYNDFLMDIILEMFPPAEAVEFLEAMEKPRPTTIRVNTIKSKRRDLVQNLTKRGMNVEALEKWSKVGLQVFESNVPIAGTVEYLAGHYMLQSAVSYLPVMALMPEENERVLDMSAAPGGKTTYIAQMMKNTGILFANDVSEPRCKSLNANLQRLGVTNCLVTNYDGFGYNKVMKNFNKTLLDAPCTGCGIISRDKSIKTSKTYEDVQRASQLQRRLLLSAIDCTKTGGFIVYSTCSFLVEEDEAVVDYALRRRNVRVVEMGLPFGRPGVTKFRHSRYDPQVAMSRKYFPHVHNMDGFYVCKLEKIGEETREVEANRDEDAAAQTKERRAATKEVLKAGGQIKGVNTKKGKNKPTGFDIAIGAPIPALSAEHAGKISVPPKAGGSQFTGAVPRGTKANVLEEVPEAGAKRKEGDAKKDSTPAAKKTKKETTPASKKKGGKKK